MARMVRGLTVVTAALASMAVSAIAAPGASADEPTLPKPPRYVYDVKITSTTTGSRDTSKLLATCSAGVGGTCSISRTFEVTRTIQVSLGVSRNFVASEINFSSAKSKSVRATCNSPKFTSSSQLYRAYPGGTRRWYTITRKLYVGDKVKETRKTGPHMAFDPKGVSCVLGSKR
ncbi:hypothetical protein E1295_43390 [Nonomuraea mesophila]|uniref:Uncharacterized protein n=1 Tax=Nonomuraea mesophila TaxID=2530382 RepID=A0A4R5E818_9ACTN|nr:hypothetical protein [Nonomuraea mesophila]TDE27162.1 hypothetical protein E1295_43390 [Nonomuraea mesophila]